MSFHEWFILYELLGILLITALILFCKKFRVTQFPVYHPDHMTDVFDLIFAAIVVQFWLLIIIGFVVNTLLMMSVENWRERKG